MDHNSTKAAAFVLLSFYDISRYHARRGTALDRNAILLPQSAIGRQREAIEKLRGLLAQEHTPPLAYVQTYGCQQNVADSQRLMGMLREMGCAFIDEPSRADIVLINTCAIRELSLIHI